MDFKKLLDFFTSEQVVGKMKDLLKLVKELVKRIADEIIAVDSEDLTGTQKREKVTKIVVKNVLMPFIKELPLPAGFITDKIVEFVLMEFADDLVEIVYQILVKRFKN